MKRRGIARLIPWLVGLDVLLLTGLLIINLFHIRLDAPVSVIPTLPPQQPVAEFTPEPFTLGDDPEQLLIDSSDVDRPAETSLPLDSEDRQATLVAGSFAQRGGPDFSLYLDQDTFQLIENEGRCYFTPQDSASNLYLEIAYFNGVEADVLAPSVFQDYGIIIQKDEVKSAELNGQSARHVTAKTMENELEAYVLDADGGCITLVLCTPGTAKAAHQDALTASLQSFELTQRD